MTSRVELALAFGLAAIAGWIDVTTFLHFRGLFVSFMSGNTTELGSAIGFDAHLALKMIRAIAVFLIGVTLGELVGGIRRDWEHVAVLALVTALLLLSIASELWHLPSWWSATILGLAMGVENASLHKAGKISLALTYVTGTLVNIGRNAAGFLRGEATSKQTLIYMGLWSSLLAGAVLGSVLTRCSFLLSESAAAAATASLALFSFVQLRSARGRARAAN